MMAFSILLLFELRNLSNNVSCVRVTGRTKIQSVAAQLCVIRVYTFVRGSVYSISVSTTSPYIIFQFGIFAEFDNN
jgi:hypothetical protein